MIWGLGTNGRNLIDVLGKDKIVAIIDSDEKIQQLGTYKEIPIISYKQYLEGYREFYIIVTPMKYVEIEEKLKKDGVCRYFIQANCKASNLLIKTVIDESFNDRFLVYTEKNYKIKGVNLFSVYLYQYMKRKNMSVEIEGSNESEKRHIRELKKIKCIDEDTKKEITNEYIFIDTDAVENNDSEETQVFLSSEKLNELIYGKWKKDIEAFKNTIINKRIFIVATGPSIRLEDLELLHEKKELTMSVNGIYNLFEKMEWRPTYYVVSDGLAIREYADYCKIGDVMPKTEKFLSDNYLDFWLDDKDRTYHCFRQIQQSRGMEFSDDCAEQVYSGSTVVYACLQLAVYMGAKEIYLLGCDFSFSKDMSAEENHCYKKKNVTYTFDFNRVKQGYEKARKYAEEHGIKIYNATRGGKLEVFERVNFDDLF